jgi:hypothetical protein
MLFRAFDLARAARDLTRYLSAAGPGGDNATSGATGAVILASSGLASGPTGS